MKFRIGWLVALVSVACASAAPPIFTLVTVDGQTSPNGHKPKAIGDINGDGKCDAVTFTLNHVDDVVPGEYELQVSSPGLDRRFYRDSDYRKFIGRLVRVKTAKAIRGLHVIVGKLKDFDGSTIVVTDPAMKKDADYMIPLADIKETRLEVEM